MFHTRIAHHVRRQLFPPFLRLAHLVSEQVFHVLVRRDLRTVHAVKSFFNCLANRTESNSLFEKLWSNASPDDDMKVKGTPCLRLHTSKIGIHMTKNAFVPWAFVVV